MRPDVIRIQVFVPQDEAFGLGPGLDAVVRVPEIPIDLSGKVTRIATALQPGSRTLTEIDVSNPDGALNPGIYCTIELLSRKTPSVLIPADAVVFDQNGLHVAVVENGTAHLQKITIARDFGREVDPSAITARTVQDLTASPSISRVQAALRRVATDVRSRETEIVSQHMNQKLPRFDGSRVTEAIDCYRMVLLIGFDHSFLR